MANPTEPRDGAPPADLLLQYLVVLAGTDPLVWRRIRVPADYTFWDLHVAIQDAMGWSDHHLHEFRVSSGTIAAFGIPDPDMPGDRTVGAVWTEFPLDYTPGHPPPIQYIYDFGDDWVHAVVFEGFEQATSKPVGPECVGGGGACPPEDCGGPQGYADLLEALADPNHPEHEDLLDWAGGPVDPVSFSPKDVLFDDPKERWQNAFGNGATQDQV